MSALTRKHLKSTRQQKTISTGTWVWLAVALATVVLLVLIFATSSTKMVGKGGSQDFTAKTLNGETIRLTDYRGQVVMLNFWATWCPPCRAEMPTIETVYERYHDRGFTVLAINNAEQPSQISAFTTSLGLRFPIVLDTTARLQQQFKVSAYPTSIFINANGEIYATHSGGLTEQQLTAYLEQGFSQE